LGREGNEEEWREGGRKGEGREGVREVGRNSNLYFNFQPRLTLFTNQNAACQFTIAIKKNWYYHLLESST